MPDHEAIDRRGGYLMTDLDLNRLPNLTDIEDATNLRSRDKIGQYPLFHVVAEMAPTATSATWAIRQARRTMAEKL